MYRILLGLTKNMDIYSWKLFCFDKYFCIDNTKHFRRMLKSMHPNIKTYFSSMNKIWHISMTSSGTHLISHDYGGESKQSPEGVK